MIRKNIFTRALVGALIVVLTAPLGVRAEDNGAGRDQAFSRAQLDQMLAPIALYPDSLLAQILMAATYPDQAAEADHWVKDHPDLKGDALNTALDQMNWDLSIKALVPFPQVLAMMDEHIDWTTKLGQAFLAQQKEVMGEIQLMRQKAYAAGNLKSTPQQKVVASGEDIEIEPAEPDVVYVPYYDPWEIYGAWWWPDYPPFAWYPFGWPYITVGLFGFGWGIGVSPFWGWGWGYWDWGGRNCYINVNRTVNINDRHSHITRSGLRTANLTRTAATRVADPVRAAALAHGGRVAAGSKAASARVGAAGRAGASGAGAAGRASVAAGNAVHRPSAASITRQLSRGGTAPAIGGSHGTGFAGGASHFDGSVSHFGGRGFSGFGGGHFGGGGFAGFGGGHFGGGHFGGGGRR